MGMIALYMLLVIVAAFVSAFVQTIAKVYVGPWSSFIADGDNYRYNYILYFIGLVMFCALVHLLYNVLLKKRLAETVIFRGDKIATVVVVLIGCALMFVALLAETFLLFGLTNNIGPDGLSYLTLLGWPVATAIYMFVRLSMDL